MTAKMKTKTEKATAAHIKSHFVVAGVTGPKRRKASAPKKATYTADAGTPGTPGEISPAPLAALPCRELTAPSPAVKPARKRPASLAEMAALVGVSGLEKFTSWKSLYNENGRLCLVDSSPDIEELAENDDGETCLNSLFTSPRKAAAQKTGEYLKACMAYVTGEEMQAEFAKWQNGTLAGRTRKNPDRIASQCIIYGIDTGAANFICRTPQAWKNAGYELADTARPILIFTPLFSDKDKQKAEQDGAMIIEADAPAGNESADADGDKKKQKRLYAVHAVFCPVDVQQVRKVKRVVRKAETAPASDVAAAVSAYTPADGQAAAVQLALSL